MEDYPKTILSFEKTFSTEQACREYLFKLRWPDGFRCPRCGESNYWTTKGGDIDAGAAMHKYLLQQVPFFKIHVFHCVFGFELFGI